MNFTNEKTLKEKKAVTITDPRTGKKRKIIVEISGSQTTEREWQKQLKVQEDEKYSSEMIDYDIASSDTIDDAVRYPLSNAIALLPRKVIDYIRYDYIFLAERDDNSGTYWGMNDCRFKNVKGFIIIYPSIWEKSKIEIALTVAHEIAHAWNKDNIDTPEKTEMKFARVREISADKLAVKWLKKHFREKDLKKLCNYWGNRKWERNKL